MDDRIKKTKLTFPEVEEVLTKDGKLIIRGAQDAAVGKAARNKFSRMAFKVLTQIVTDKEIDDGQGDTENKENEKARQANVKEDPRKAGTVKQDQDKPQKLTPRNTNTSSGTKKLTPPVVRIRKESAVSNATNDSKSKENDTPRRRSRQGSFMSLVKLATLKKRIGGGGKKKGSTESMENIAEEDDFVELPTHPRFCATLSAEAQYAMLKCYEDVLLDGLKTTKREPSGVLYRVKTPHASVQSIQMSGVPVTKKPQSLAPINNAPQTPLPVPEISTPQPSLIAPPPNLSYGQPMLTRTFSGSSLANRSESRLEPIAKDHQLRMSVRFQTAMDILDNIRQEKGIIVTSANAKTNELNPIRNYNMWSKSWSREFQFEVVVNSNDKR